jgi:hypothetical protein
MSLGKLLCKPMSGVYYYQRAAMLESVLRPQVLDAMPDSSSMSRYTRALVSALELRQRHPETTLQKRGKNLLYRNLFIFGDQAWL